ncbi:hypothetical protein MMC12_005794, partial [Toensbergia leucococca]|nr:hypothetical protein [Toensbergia leucococca]
MALVLASAANVQPDTALAQALRDYEAVLSNDQRSRLHSHRGSVPNAAAAINLTTEIDQENNGRMGRGVGPRFITFLESLQQFSSVLDTFVSSNPQMAALVWGGVKLALLAVKNVTSYFDKLSMLFMSIGRTSPRFNQFGLLYSTSPGLQKALCDYYAVIVHLCKHVIEFTQKPAFSQISSAFLKPFDVEFAPFQGQLQSLSQAIRDETSLAANRAQEQEFQLQAFERREASKERSLLSVFRDRTAQEQEETQRWRLDAKSRKLKETRRTFLDALSAYDHQTAWKQARKQCLIGTSTWIQHTQSFIDWLRRSSSASLWCTGKLGSGKTVSAACVVTHLMTEVSSNDVISFFFCRYDDPFSLKARTIIGSLLRQLLNDLPVVTFVKLDQQASDDILDVDQIVDLFESTLPRVRQYFIVVDGLDECDESETKDFFKAIKRLLQIPELRIKFYCSGRPNLVTLVSPRLRPDWHIMTDSTEATTDINHFIDITLEQCLEDGDLRLGDPALILTIQNSLRRGAQG